MSKLLVVVGATGAQGSAVVDYFMKNEPSYKIRGLTRKPNSDVGAELSKKGVEVVQADLEDLESLKKAFNGAHAIFAYTNFMEAIASPETRKKLESGEGPIGKVAIQIEVRQGKNIAEAAASVPELERLVWSSLCDVKKWSKGKYQHVYHFDSKAEILEYMHGVTGLEGKVSSVQMSVFLDNPIKIPQMWRPVKQTDGSYVLSLLCSAEKKIPWIDVAEDTGAFVSALLKVPGGTHVVGSTEDLSVQQWIDLWSSHLGVNARVEKMSRELAVQDDPTGIVEEMMQSFEFMDEYPFDGGDPDVFSPDEFEQKFGVKIPRSKVADHIKRSDWSAVL